MTTQTAKTPAQKAKETRARNKKNAQIKPAMQKAEAQEQTILASVSNLPALHKDASDPIDHLKLTKQQRFDVKRQANEAGLVDSASFATELVKKVKKDVQAGIKDPSEAVAQMREIMGEEFSATFFQNVEFDGIKKLHSASATLKDAGRAIRGDEGRWLYKVKELKAETVAFIEENADVLPMDTLKAEIICKRNMMNQFAPVLNYAATGSTNKGGKLSDMIELFAEKLKAGDKEIRQGALSAGADVGDTYPKNLGNMLKRIGAGTVSGASKIVPDYSHPVIAAIAAR